MGGRMRISILNKNNSDNYKNEYKKMMKILTSKCITFEKKKYAYFDYMNTYLFNTWPYRGTYLDIYEYLRHIGISENNKKITLDNLLNLIEFLLNMQLLLESSKYYSERTTYSVKCSSIIFHNIPVLLEEYSYQAYDIDDKVYIYQQDIEYEDILETLPDNIKELILTYKSINSNGIKTKRLILEKIYYYLEKHQEKYKKYNPTIYNTIKIVITKMGIIGNMDKKYQELSNYKLKKYYDYCFELIMYLIKTENILKYRDEIRNYNE